MGTVYLCHFDKPVSDNHTTQHYLGYAEHDVSKRLERHKQGQGARLTQVAIERGITFDVVRTWENVSRSFERRLKNQKNSKRYCPVCCVLSLSKGTFVDTED